MNKNGMKMVVMVYGLAAVGMLIGMYVPQWGAAWGWSPYNTWCVALILLGSVPAIIAILIEKLFGS